MLSLELSEFLIQLKDGVIKNVGGPTKAATVKLFGVTSVEARPFGDNRLKCIFADDAGNHLEVALFPAEAASLLSQLEEVGSSGAVDGFEVDDR